MGGEILEEVQGYICTLTINRPEKQNALNSDVLKALGDVLNKISNQSNIRMVILRGAGEKAFCSGGDLSSSGSKELSRFIKALEYCLQSLLDFPIPVAAMIFGPAVGLGLDIAVIADFRLAAQNAYFGANPVKIGRIYYYTSTKRLLNLIGAANTTELLLTGRFIDATRAKEINLVNWVYPQQDLIQNTYSFAQEFVEENAPLAVKGTKAMIKKLLENPVLTQDVEEDLKKIINNVNNSQDALEGARAFLEKRKPIFIGK